MKTKLNKLWHIAIFAALFALLGIAIPQTYYRFLDNKEYITYVDNVTFDKNEYEPCETQITQSTFKITIDSPIHINSRLYLQRGDSNTNEIIKEYEFDSFLKAEESPQIHIVKTQLPCDLEPGIYFYRGLLTYEIRGITHYTSFASEQFTIK